MTSQVEKAIGRNGKVYRLDFIKYLMAVMDNQVATKNAVWLVSNLEKLLDAVIKDDWMTAKTLAHDIVWEEIERSNRDSQ